MDVLRCEIDSTFLFRQNKEMTMTWEWPCKNHLDVKGKLYLRSITANSSDTVELGCGMSVVISILSKHISYERWERRRTTNHNDGCDFGLP